MQQTITSRGHIAMRQSELMRQCLHNHEISLRIMVNNVTVCYTEL